MSPPGFDTEPKYSPNGRWIVFARLREDVAEDEAAVFITGAAGGRVRQLTPWHAVIEHPTWSPDSRWIAFNTPEGTIEAIRPDGSERHTILPALEGRGGHKPWFSPDGTRILFMCENQGLTEEVPADYDEDICVMNADGSHIVDLTNTPGKFENFPSWAPAPSGRGER
jgi:Tol biopolymer transport system component